MRRTAALLALLAAAAGFAVGARAEPEVATHSCVRGNELWFRAADRTRLVGHRFGRGSTAVVLGHQSSGSLCEWVPYARRLARLGYFVFPFDLRGHGFSQWRAGRAGNRLAGDVAAAVRTVRRLGKRKVFVVGASMGATASLLAAANVRPVLAGVVSLSAPADFRGMDARKAAPRLAVPVLYVAAVDDDGGRFADDARALHAATRASDKRLEIIDRGLHGVTLVDSDPTVRALVEAFLRSR